MKVFRQLPLHKQSICVGKTLCKHSKQDRTKRENKSCVTSVKTHLFTQFVVFHTVGCKPKSPPDCFTAWATLSPGVLGVPSPNDFSPCSLFTRQRKSVFSFQKSFYSFYKTPKLFCLSELESKSFIV